MLNEPPECEFVIPPVVMDLAGGRDVRPVWLNELGGLTCEVGAGTGRCFVKWAPAGSGLDLIDEAARIIWVRPFSPVPEVITSGEDGDGSWLVTTALPGASAVADVGKQEPAKAVAAIGTGLRHLHDHAPAGTCPFSWSADNRIAIAHQRVVAGRTNTCDWHESHQHLSIADALAIVDDPPSTDQLVVCHGDACSPNTIIDGGRWSGHVDLGELGVGDRWADLAIATWSTEWNYGPGWESALLDSYGIEADPQRTAYYRLLWDLT